MRTRGQKSLKVGQQIHDLDKLYFLISSKPPTKIANAYYFSIDQDLEYEPFYQDFGPLNLAKIWKFSTEVAKILEQAQSNSTKFYHLTSTDYKKNTNAALLMCTFSILVLKKSAQDAYAPFKHLEFKAFRDASYGQCTYECTIMDCLRGLQYAIKLGWFNFKSFNIQEYEHYERVENGDLNWIIPGKFVAFSSPSDEKVDKYGYKLLAPKEYVPIFKKIGVTSVIRLNTKTYDSQGFTLQGIKHFEMFFTDGTCPPSQIVDKFLQAVESDGVFAVHCKAGLGRTGTLIGLYAMKHYMFKAADFIGWIRLCRPGSILGPQQYYMIKMEKEFNEKCIKQSEIWKGIKEKLSEEDVLKQLNEVSIKQQKMSKKEEQIKKYGEKDQGQNLQLAKNKLNK